MISTTLQWKLPDIKPPVSSPDANFPIAVSAKCLVKTDHPTATLVVATFVKPKAKDEDAFWHDDNGNVIKWNILAWTDLTATEHLLDSLFVEVEGKKIVALTQDQKDQLAQDFDNKCNSIIANKITCEHHANNQDFIKKNLLPDWSNFRDLRKSYLKGELVPDDAVFLDKLIDDNFARYSRYLGEQENPSSHHAL